MIKLILFGVRSKSGSMTREPIACTGYTEFRKEFCFLNPSCAARKLFHWAGEEVYMTVWGTAAARIDSLKRKRPALLT